MAHYVVFYSGTQIEVEASSSYEAQQKALPLFQAKQRARVKQHMVSPVLASLSDGTPVSHSTGAF